MKAIEKAREIYDEWLNCSSPFNDKFYVHNMKDEYEQSLKDQVSGILKVIDEMGTFKFPHFQGDFIYKDDLKQKIEKIFKKTT